MNTLRLMMLLTCIGSYGQEAAMHPGRVAAVAVECFTGTRKEIANAIRLGLNGPMAGGKDLEPVISVTARQLQVLIEENFDLQLANAERLAEEISKKLAGSLKDPANKAALGESSVEECKSKIRQAKACGALLIADLSRLRATLTELQQWALLYERVETADNLSSLIKKRLVTLSAEWSQEPKFFDTAPPPPATKVVPVVQPETLARRGVPPPPLGVCPEPAAQKRVASLSANGGAQTASPVQWSNDLLALVKMVSGKVPSSVIRTYIEYHPRPFRPSSTESAALRKILGEELVSALFRHDQLLKDRSLTSR